MHLTSMAAMGIVLAIVVSGFFYAITDGSLGLVSTQQNRSHTLETSSATTGFGSNSQNSSSASASTSLETSSSKEESSLPPTNTSTAFVSTDTNTSTNTTSSTGTSNTIYSSTATTTTSESTASDSSPSLSSLSSTTTSGNSWTQSTVPVGTYHIRVDYSAVDQSICASYPWACSWTGSIENNDTFVAYVIGPTSGSGSYPFWIQNCGQKLLWSFQVSTGSYLTVSVLDQNGAAVNVETTLMKSGESLNGYYYTCASTGMTTTVTFPVTLTTTTGTATTTYHAQTTVTASLTYFIRNQTACAAFGCNYYALWAVDYPSQPSCAAICLYGTQQINQTYTVSLSCDEEMQWSFSLYAPQPSNNVAPAQLLFRVQSANGTVIISRSTSSTSYGITWESWRPACVNATSTSTFTRTEAQMPSASAPPLAGTLIVGFALTISAFISLKKKQGLAR